MVTVNNDENSENENSVVIDRIQSLIDRFKEKQIKQEYVENELIFYAKNTGFKNNTLRKQAWSLLANIPSYLYSNGMYMCIIVFIKYLF